MSLRICAVSLSVRLNKEPLMRHPVQFLDRETKEASHGQAPRPIGE
jgi:hypothetical protein